MHNLILRELNEHDEAAFLVGWREYNDMELSCYTFVWKPGVSWLDHIECLRKGKLGIDLRADRVPDSMYYCFLNGAIIGRLSLRHELNEFLRTRGGLSVTRSLLNFAGSDLPRRCRSKCCRKQRHWE